MPRLDRLPELQRRSSLAHPCLLNDSSPFTRLTRPLRDSRLALVSTAGIQVRGDEPFTGGDQSFRVIPADTPRSEIVQSHASIGFDRTAFQRDINVVFPMDRAREFVERREVGSLGTTFYSFMGAQRPPYDRLLQETGPEVARRLRADGVDVVFLTGTWPLCTHTVGVLARVFEEHGLVTTSISLVREHTEKVKPPRALFVPFPFGHPLGEANDAELQTQVMRAAFALLEADSGPVLEEYPDDIYANQDINLAQASGVAQPQTSTDVAFELTTLRPYYEQWLAAHDGRTSVGVTRVDQRRFRGLIRLLEGYAEDREVDVPEWNKDVPLPQFVRWASDDLKAFYLEARMQQKPDATFQQLNEWLWSETALSNLLRAVRDRMRASGDPKLDAIAFGIAR